jgi:hypothetical protein
LLAPGPGCPSTPANPITTKPLCIKCPAGQRVVAVAGWWDAAAKLVNGLEVTCSNGAAVLSGLKTGITSRVIIPDGDLLSEVSSRLCTVVAWRRSRPRFRVRAGGSALPMGLLLTG